MLQKIKKRRIQEVLIKSANANSAFFVFFIAFFLPVELLSTGYLKEDDNAHVIFLKDNKLSDNGKKSAQSLTDFAVAYIKIRHEGKFSEESIKLLMDSVSQNPYGIPPLKLLVAHWTRRNKSQEMLDNFLPLAKQNPKAIRLNILTSETLIRLDKEKEAVKLLEKSVDEIDFETNEKVTPDLLGELISRLADLYAQENNVSAGENLWDEALEIPALADQLILRIAAAEFFAKFADQGPDGFFAGWSKRRYRRKLEENLQKFAEFWARDEMTNALILTPVLRIYKRYDKQDEAERILLKMFVNNPYNSSAMLLLAKTYADFKRFNDAVRVWQIMIDSDKYKKAGFIWRLLTSGKGNEGDFYLELASVALQAENYKEAIRAFDWYLLLNPDDPEALFQLGITYMRIHEYTKAILKLELVKGLPEADFYRARCYIIVKRYEKALEALDDAAETARKYNRSDFLDKDYYFEYAFAADQAGAFKKAEAILKDLIQENPDDPTLNNFLGYLWAEKGVNLDEAKKLVQKALQKDCDNAAYIDSMAWILYKKKEYEKALNKITRALELEGDMPDAVIAEHAGDIFSALGDKTNALKYWKMALEIYSEDIDINEVKEKIDRIRDSNFEKL